MRECGPCTACCKTFEIVAIGKPINETCPHVCGDGCDIYAERPEECRGYYCLWMAGAGLELPEWARPDRTGLVLNSRTSDINKRDLVAFEVEKGSSKGYWAGKLLLWLVKKRFLVTVQYGKKPDRLLFRRGDARVG